MNCLRTSSDINITFPNITSGIKVKTAEMIAKAYATLFFNKSLKIPVPLLCMNNLNNATIIVLFFFSACLNSCFKYEYELIHPTSSFSPGVEVKNTLHDFVPFVFCLYGVQLQEL